MANQTNNSKRIVINTTMLYIRMFVTMAVGLFTSRVVLDVLGVEDFGIYNVVGGFVAMFAIVRSGLVSSTQRFITFDLGTGDTQKLRQTFSTIVLIYMVLCTLVLIMAELGGVWFIESKLTIPAERMDAARWVFHLSLITLVVTLVSSPYNALIIAHERMKAFAYISIYENFAKLAVAYLIYMTTYDKLVVYAILLCFVQSTVPILYWAYCRRNFREETNFVWKLNWKKVGEIYSFAGWSMMGGLAHMGFTQGLNMLLGMFFTPVINAARGVAVQVQGMIIQFVSNFQMAVDPQIIKSYVRGDVSYMAKLVSNSARFSYFMLLFISLPILCEAETLLGWWLVEVPDNTAVFFRLICISTIFDSISNPYAKAIHATGRIRNYQLLCSTILLIIVPVAYVVLKLGAPAYSVFIVHIVLAAVAMVCRIIMAEKILGLTFADFVHHTLFSILTVTLLSTIAPLAAHFCLSNENFRFFIVGFLSVISVGLSVYFIGLTNDERNMVMTKMKSIIKR